MKILNEFDKTLLKNEDKFNDSFFKRFNLKKRKIKLGDVMEKEYSFPTFYGDVTCAQAIYLCSYDKALALMPHSKIKPVRMPGGRAVLAISCYEYKNVMGVPPYNEIAFTIAVEVDKAKSPILLPVLKNTNSGYYVFSMPVTSRENCLRGNYIWGLPKVTEQIDIYEEGDECVIKCYEADGAEYFSLRVPKEGKAKEFDTNTYLFSKLNGKILKAETNFKATMNINMFIKTLLFKKAKPKKPYLELSDTKSGQRLKDLDISPLPLQFRYGEHMSSCFNFYDENYNL
ncbi:hypothetical protein EOM82_04285 [bacterium]|nr:hypothetical protein [bacterium]